MPNATQSLIDKRMFKHEDYRRVMQVRILEDQTDKMIIEGKAISFDDPTVLFKMGGVEYKEIIAKGALNEADLSYAFLKYNHSDHIMAMARTKNGTLQIEIRDDGVWIKAELANTTAGRDLFELIKRGDIDKMSFAFTIREESYDTVSNTWTVRKIDRLYDVAAVTVPAYENTELFARRYAEVETKRREEVETLELARRRARIRLEINIKTIKN